MARKPDPAPGWLFRCDKLQWQLELRLYDNRVEADIPTYWLCRYKRTDVIFLKDVLGVQVQRKQVTLSLSGWWSSLFIFRRADDALEFSRMLSGLIGR